MSCSTLRWVAGLGVALLVGAVSLVGSSGLAMMNDEEFAQFGASPTMSVSCTVPPAVMWVEDSQGRRSGVDSTKPISPVGEGTALEEIPLSQVMDQNIGSDDPETLGRQNPQTRWSVCLASQRPAQYRLYLAGLGDGIEEVVLTRIDRTPGTAPDVVHEGTRDRLLVSAGVTRELVLGFDPESPTVRVIRVVVPEQLAGGVGAACRLGQIAPEGICTSLKAKAEAAARAKERGNVRAAAGELRAFLKELDAQGGKHVMEPALTILREEAEAAIVQLVTPAMEVAKKRKKPWWKSLWPF